MNVAFDVYSEEETIKSNLTEQNEVLQGALLQDDAMFDMQLQSNEQRKTVTFGEVYEIGGGGEGVTDHRLLSGRDAENQNPIGAIA